MWKLILVLIALAGVLGAPRQGIQCFFTNRSVLKTIKIVGPLHPGPSGGSIPQYGGYPDVTGAGNEDISNVRPGPSGKGEWSGPRSEQLPGPSGKGEWIRPSGRWV